MVAQFGYMHTGAHATSVATFKNGEQREFEVDLAKREFYLGIVIPTSDYLDIGLTLGMAQEHGNHRIEKD